jgi:hypothetical protein
MGAAVVASADFLTSAWAANDGGIPAYKEILRNFWSKNFKKMNFVANM